MRNQRARRVKRCIQNDPKYTCFKPSWVPKNQIEKVEILVWEYEAMRLRDVLWLNMQQWAEKMWVSAPTFNRMVNSAHTKIADAIVNWKWIRIYTKDESTWDSQNLDSHCN